MADEHLISLQPGTVIAGRYEVVKCLGAGSMGLVYACRHRELAGHMVAVKVLFPEVAHDKTAAARFRNEIFASYGVSHPNVVRAYEYLRDGDLVAYTMEYVDGGALADRLERRERLVSIAEAVNVLAQMCCGVQAVHDAGIVHRDLKPENILLTRDNVVKIADFGIARTGHGPRLTEHGGVVGTIDYVSPEYMLNSQVDWRSDIYAMGILGYEMITGESPFRGDSVYATMTKRLKTDPQPPSSVRADCPKELDRIILRAMHRNPESRYQSAAEMFYDLQEMAPQASANSGSVVTSGAYIHLSRHGSETYVGPVLNPGSESGAESPGLALVEATQQPDPDAEFERRPQARTAFYERATPVRSRFEDDENIEDTRSLGPDTVSLAGSFQNPDTIHEPVQMESVLNFTERGTGGWTSQSVPSESNILSSSIDGTRIRQLSQLAEVSSRSPWLDMVTSVVAVLIGVGVGFAILTAFYPEYLQQTVTPENGDES